MAKVTEEQLAGWTDPSSTTEQDKQDRTERMIREAINTHDAFKGSSYKIYAKGSYANNTNVKFDSDVETSGSPAAQSFTFTVPGFHDITVGGQAPRQLRGAHFYS